MCSNQAGNGIVGAISKAKNSKRTWKGQKTQQYQTHKKSIKLTKTQTTELVRQVPASALKGVLFGIF